MVDLISLREQVKKANKHGARMAVRSQRDGMGFVDIVGSDALGRSVSMRAGNHFAGLAWLIEQVDKLDAECWWAKIRFQAQTNEAQQA